MLQRSLSVFGMILLTGMMTQAQQGCKVWDKRFGGSGSDWSDSHCAVPAVGGGYFIGGESTSGISGDHSQTGWGSFDYWVVRMSESGVKLWDKRFGTTGSDILGSVVATADGGCLLAGRSDSGISGDRTEDSRGQEDYWIVKVDANGVKEWDKRFGGIYQEYLFSALQAADGGFYLIGYSNSYVAPSGDKTQAGGNGSEIWIVRTDASGIKLWDKIFYGPQGTTTCHSALMEANGDVVLGGSATSNNAGHDVSQPTRGGSDCWILRMSPSGVKLWDHRFGGPAGDYTDRIVKANDGGYWVTAQSSSGIGGEHSQDLRGQSDYWLLKLNASGDLTWERRFGGSATDHPYALHPTNDGGVIVAGYTSSPGDGDLSMPLYSSSADMWVVKVSSTGSKVWDAHYGGSGTEQCFDIVTMQDGSLLYTGNSDSGINGDVSETSRGNTDLWMIKVDGTAATTYYADLDADGFGDPARPLLACAGVQQAVTNSLDNCPSVAGQIGSTCSDGNACTTNDVLNASCQCVGTISPDSDGDGICNAQDFCPGPGTIGTPCNDGNTCTINDALNASCQCAGTVLPVGSACDDGNASTVGDVWTTACTCQGTAPPCVQWDSRFGTLAVDGLTCAIPSGDGGYLLGGWSDGAISGDKSQGSQGGSDWWLVKISAQGVKQWDKRYGGNSSDVLNAMVPAIGGGFLLAGSSQSGISGDKTQASQGGQDYWVMKVDVNGTKIWDKRFGGTGNDALSVVKVTADGGYVLGGTSNSDIGGDKSEGHWGATDLWAVKIDANGTKLWDKRFGGTGTEGTVDLVSLADGYIICGHSYSPISGDKTQANWSVSSANMWAVRTDLSGTKLWDKRYGGTGGEDNCVATVLLDGNVLLGCRSGSGISGDRTQSNQGAQDYWLVKVDPSNGVKLWDKRFGGNSSDYPYDLTQTSNGVIMITGGSLSGLSGDRTEASQGGRDAWTVAMDQSGTKLWDKRYGGSGDENARAIVLTADGGFLLASEAYAGSGGDRSQLGRGLQDYWVVRSAPNSPGTWYADADGDGHGNPSVSQVACQLPAGYVKDNIDCNDGNASIYAGATCDDGNANTTNETYGSNCQCAQIDCSGALNGTSFPGTPCNDNNAATVFDAYQLDCTCAGLSPSCRAWDQRFGGSTADYMNAMVAAGDGGYMLGGTSSSGATGDRTQATQGGSDYWMLRTDGFGNKKWDARFGTSAADQFNAMARSSDGGFLLGGYTTGGISGDKTEATQGSDDFWVVKVNASGTKLWDKRYGGTASDQLFAVANTLDGGFLLGGSSASGIGGDKTEDTRGSTDFWVVRIDAAGNKLWDRRFGGTSGDVLAAILALSDGSFVLAGGSSSGVGGDKTVLSRGGTDYWLVKIDATGTKLWDQRYGTTDTDEAKAISVTSGGQLLISGYSYGTTSGDRTAVTRGGSDFWIVRTDASGNKLWDKAFGGTSNDLAVAHWQLADGGAFIAGVTGSPASGEVLETSRGGNDIWVVRVDNAGTELWDKRFGGASEDYARAVFGLSDDSFVAGGHSSSGSEGDKSQTSRGSYDQWIIKGTGSATTLFADVDGDGFGNAAAFAPGCEAVAGNYVANALDCDDSNNQIYPNATCNDGDAWTTSSSWTANCACAGTVSLCTQWDSRIGSKSYDAFKALVACAEGGYLIAMDNTGATGNVGVTSHGSDDYWVARVNASGGLAWQFYYGGSASDDVTCAVRTSDGGFLVGGGSASGISGDRTQASQGGQDYWIVKLDANGVKQWDKRYGGAQDDILRKVVQTSDGGFLLVGDAISGISGDKTEANCDFQNLLPDVWVIKVDASGTIQWQKSLSGYADDYTAGVAITADGGYVVGITIYGSGAGCVLNEFGSGFYGDYWAVKLSTSGALQWQQRLQTAADERMRAVAADPDGGVVLVGESTAHRDGDHASDNHGGKDIWLVKLDASGALMWERSIGGTGNELAADGITMPSSGFLVLGTTSSAVGGDVTGTPRGGDDYWVMRANAEGRKTWDLRYGSSTVDNGVALALASDGYPVFAGTSDGVVSGDKTQPPWTNSWETTNVDGWLVKIGLPSTWYADSDGDGFGNGSNTSVSCTKPAGYVTNTQDCNDNDAAIFPGAICNDNINGNEASAYTSACQCVSQPAMCRQWDARFGSTGSDYASDIIRTSDGGFLVGGWTTAGIGGDKTEDSRGAEDYWVAKLDANGVKQWDKRYGGSQFEILTCLLQANDGGYLIGGYTYATSSGGDMSTGGFGNTDFWVVKTDANGVKQWDRHYGGYDLDWMQDMVIAPDGGYLFAGLTWSSDGQVSQLSRGAGDYWVIKVNDSGTKIWDKRYGSTANEYLYKVVNTSDGGYALSGESDGPASGEKGENSRGGADIWVVKINSTGTLQWERTLGGSAYEAGYGLAAAQDGGVLVGGQSSSGISGDRSQASRGFGDFWTVRLDMYGTKLWDRRFGSTGSDRLMDIGSTTDGGFLLAGYGVDPNGDCTVNTNGSYVDQWVVKVDANGTKLWDRGYLSSGSSETHAMCTTPDGLAMLAESNSGIGWDRSQNSRGGSDYWVVRLANGQEGEWYLDYDGDGQAGTPTPGSQIAHACSAPTGFGLPTDCNDSQASIYPGALCNDGNSNTSLDQYNSSCVCTGTNFTVKVAPKVFLDGPFDAGTNLMSDALRLAGFVPQSEPFTGIGYAHTGGGGSEVLFPNVLSVTGNNAIVDWVVVELRNNANPSIIVATSSALVQRDGDVVDVDGVSPVGFSAAVGTYKLAIRHRNHLGAMTLNGVALNATPVTVDLTISSTATYGTNARRTNGTKRTLWPGDVVRDGIVKYTGSNNDRDPILAAIGGINPTNTLAGYRREDVNMDGVVKYTGANNDRDIILVMIGGTIPTNTLIQQLP